MEWRATQQVERYRDVAPDWRAPWDVATIAESVFDDMGDALRAMPCPALDDAGDCLIYEHRPATCRMTGLPMLANATILENVCPIVDSSPAYASLAPLPFDLAGVEDRAADCDADARRRGYVSTTVAGAIAGAVTP